MEEIYGKIYELAGPYLDTRDNDLHTRVAHSFALKLLEVEGGDEKIVIPAVLLHDVGWKAVPEELQLKAFGPSNYNLELNRIHEVEGAKIARELLQQAEYNPELVDQICEIILGHDSRHEAISHDDALVKDSDKLWRFSREAISLDSRRFRVDPVAHIAWLGRQIDSWFLTASAKNMALVNHELRLIEISMP